MLEEAEIVCVANTIRFAAAVIFDVEVLSAAASAIRTPEADIPLTTGIVAETLYTVFANADALDVDAPVAEDRKTSTADAVAPDEQEIVSVTLTKRTGFADAELVAAIVAEASTNPLRPYGPAP
jgi:hypothetical protein